MNDLDRYRDHVIERDLSDTEPISASGGIPLSELIKRILKRWYIVLAIFLIVSLIGVSAIWLLIKPKYNVSGAIRVAPILTGIFGETDRGEMGSIEVFMNTQAQIMTSNNVVQRVADDLAKKDLAFFNDYENKIEYKLKQAIKGIKTKPEISSVLKKAISDGVITAQTRKRTELIEISMESNNSNEAQKIVNSFIREYMAAEGSSATKDEDQKLSILEDEEKIVAGKRQDLRQKIYSLAQEYGDIKLDTRHQMKLDRISSLLASLTQYEADRIRLEAKVQLLEQKKTEKKIGPEELLQMRNLHINTNPSVSSLVTHIENIERDLIIARQLLTLANPEITRKVEQINILNDRLEAKKIETGTAYDKLVEELQAQSANVDLDTARAELEATREYEQRFRDILSKEDIETIDLGRKQLAIQGLQDELTLAKELHNKITRRINDLAMERKRPARISIAYDADIVSVIDKRLKLTLAVLVGAMSCGVGVAFLISKADRSMYVPNDITKNVSIRIIGTTTNMGQMNKSQQPRLLIEDYQTIRANIGLLNNNGGETPRKLVVTSPVAGDGKTTLAINLATSMAKSGKKVLLIDGDMRKPDIARLLNLPKGSRGLQDYLFGKELDSVIYRMPSMKLDILASDSRNRNDAYELLASPLTPQYISSACDNYDHVIIDTPPALAFPDALLWSKMADAVILASFAGRTTGHDLRQTSERLAQINITILGTVMNNVNVGHGYNQYGYNYYSRKSNTSHKNKRSGRRIYLLAANDKDHAVSHKPYKKA